MTFNENRTQKTIHREDNIVRGGLYLVDLGDVEGRNNSLFGKIRPCCCVSCSACNKHSPVLTFVCLSSASSPEKLEKLRKMPTRVFVSKEETGMKDSTAACEQIISVPRSSIIRFVGKKLSDSTMDKINAAIRIQLEI
jgi:mRNA-degrading endonuclease toxin of MazEF toxin-antitoxin module